MIKARPRNHDVEPSPLKQKVHDFWDAESCGESYARVEDSYALSAQERARYELEPYIAGFARFGDGCGRDVLEVGVGMGADHLMWARAAPRRLVGVDLTERAIELSRARFTDHQMKSELQVADAEALPFPDASFDLVYSWGVMHHSPDTQACFNEACRVLRPGGEARIMVYHTWSLVGLMLWLRYGPVAGRPFRSMAEIYSEHLESPGTKAYTADQAREMLRQAGFERSRVKVQLSHGDLLSGNVGARHQGSVLSVAKMLWPRWLLRSVGRPFGLYLLIEAWK
jgi:ubiquinone/menaquinone biosynthesis C-methylase UbiE